MSVFDENIRRIVIDSLYADSDYSINSMILQSVLAEWGHNVSLDKVHTQIAWLEENGLVSTKKMQSIIVAQLTQRGIDVANGRARVPGIDDPLPKE